MNTRMSRSSKDIARRLRFDHRPRRDTFRRVYVAAGLMACVLGAGLWLWLGRSAGERQYLPGPLSPAHATFGDSCAHCHVAFASTPDAKCLDCHAPRIHSRFEVDTPACHDCHVEHRAPAVLLAVSDRTCVACHAALRSSRQLAVAAHIAGLADHPELAPLRPPRQDATALRFNHALHLTSEEVRETLACASCHRVDAAGRYMLPIVFESDCRRCHELKVKEAPVPIGEIEAPHDTPRAVRDGLAPALLLLGAQRPRELFTATQKVFIPGQPPRGPVDESDSLQAFQRAWLPKLEDELYRPFLDEPPLLENNKYCFLCHVQGSGRDAEGLPVVEDTKLPDRWLARAEFSHRRHDKLPCESCHGDMQQSALTSDTNLPDLRVCLQCHVDTLPQSAGTQCTLCHLYHDASRHPERRPTVQPVLSVDRLLGR